MAEEEEDFAGFDEEDLGGDDDDASALEEAMSLGDDSGDGEEDLDPLAEEMLKMMEEDEGDSGGVKMSIR